MNPEPMINQIAEQLQEMKSATTKKIHLCYFEGKLVWRLDDHTTDRHEIFIRVKTVDVPLGLTLLQWSKLAKDVSHFLQDVAATQQPTQQPTQQQLQMEANQQ